MTTDAWINEMIRDIESKKKKDNPEIAEVKLSESDMNTLADIMIKKMSNPNFDVETDNLDEDRQVTNNPKPDASGEIPIE